MTDWDPDGYAAFRALRLRPALDLLAQVGPLPRGAVMDLGCGAGAVAADLRARFGSARRLVGLDSSAAMLVEAEGLGLYDRLDEADLALWAPEAPPALLFSNAALNWLQDHETLLPRLARALAPGGTLAVQMPAQHDAPSHRLIREIAAGMFPDRIDLSGWSPAVAPAVVYHRLLAPLGRLSIWQTDYLQRLDPMAEGHPVRHFTGSTAMRPYLAPLSPPEAARFVAAYDAALAVPYPPESDGAVLFPFRRLFLVLTRPA